MTEKSQNPGPAGKRDKSVIRTITRGILADDNLRRRVMGGVIVAAAFMLMAGATFAASWLVERPVLFLIYWFACAWLTLTALLLALFDILIVRKKARLARKSLKREIFGRDKDDDVD